MIRLSKESDKQQIQQLIETCFGDRLNKKYLDNLDGRYYVIELDNKIVAMTGLCNNTKFKDGVEIDWTCTHPDFRNRGLMHKLFTKIINLTNKNIYCSCWKLPEKDYVELGSLMKSFSFNCISEAYITCDLSKCKFNNKKGCANYRPNCKCQEDLYLRNAII